MERITVRDVRAALANYVDTCERYGIDQGGRVGMDVGSATYGRGWRVYVVPAGETGHHTPRIGGDYLGWSAREAYESLTTRTRTMHDMAQALSLPRYETTRDRVESSLERDAQ